MYIYIHIPTIQDFRSSIVTFDLSGFPCPSHPLPRRRSRPWNSQSDPPGFLVSHPNPPQASKKTGALGGVQYQQSPSSSVLHSWPRPKINFSHPSDSLQQFTIEMFTAQKKRGQLFLLLFSHMQKLGIKLYPVDGQNPVPLMMSKPM